MFDINVYGMDEDELTDRQKEDLAIYVHEFIQEEFDKHPDSVGVEGYGEGGGNLDKLKRTLDSMRRGYGE